MTDLVSSQQRLVTAITHMSNHHTTVTFQQIVLESRCLNDSDRIDGEQMDFEWTLFTGLTTLGILDEFQKMMTE